MLPGRLIKSYDTRRLRNLLALLFLALAVPTAVLIWQGYRQLKWEAFHHYRTIAEELATRIDSSLIERMRTIDARSFADYGFLVVAGDPSASLVQRSPLASFPVQADLPGVLGYFQVDSDGVFSTPILPPEGTDARSLGIGESEYAGRLQLARQIQQVLSDNRLVRPRPEPGVRERVAEAPVPRERDVASRRSTEEESAAGTSDQGAARSAVQSVVPSSPAFERRRETDDYSQQVFDRLNRPQPSRSDVRQPGERQALAERHATGEDTTGRTTDVDAADSARDSAGIDGTQTLAKSGLEGGADGVGRVKRKEQIALPEPVEVGADESGANAAGPAALRISTFESEIDAFEFSLLDSGHFVLFRRVWRDGDRYIQGLLVDADRFIDEVIGEQFADTALAGMSNLAVTYDDAVLRRFDGGYVESYPAVSADLDGTLLYRSRLPAPISSLQLVFGIDRLPPGPGARVLGWATLVLGIVFSLGFVTLYRLGVGQIELARREQEFVSAVSHELRTPLTSIRMYGEMLKEGWVAEDKRQSYYEFIHDESERLSRLISNVLQLAHITRGDPQLDLKPMKLGELMRGVESKIAGQVERAGFELRVQLSDDAERAVIEVDADCFAQILINLVDNAIKFSQHAADKRIEIGGRRLTDGRVSIGVRDFGPGVPEDQMKKIFRLFYRPGSELTREAAGTGIGLAIVHQLTLLMGGSVELVNAAPGAEFSIVFPVAG